MYQLTQYSFWLSGCGYRHTDYLPYAVVETGHLYPGHWSYDDTQWQRSRLIIFNCEYKDGIHK